jgi:hypothetical protein
MFRVHVTIWYENLVVLWQRHGLIGWSSQIQVSKNYSKISSKFGKPTNEDGGVPAVYVLKFQCTHKCMNRFAI